jgi:ribosomal-protein-alanine N-acetyltransferase
VRIRRATTDDLAAIEYVERLSFDEERYRRELLESFLYEDAFTTIVAVMGKDIVAYVTVYRESSGTTCRVVSIGVLPEQRQKGIAQSLMGVVEADALEDTMGKITLEVRVTNVPAINLYLKLGYKVRGIIEDYYGKGKDAFYMEKDLLPAKNRLAIPTDNSVIHHDKAPGKPGSASSGPSAHPRK